MNSTPGAIRDLHDGVIWLQLPESFTFSVSWANQSNGYLNPTENLNNKGETKGILVDAVKWRQRANRLLDILNKLNRRAYVIEVFHVWK